MTPCFVASDFGKIKPVKISHFGRAVSVPGTNGTSSWDKPAVVFLIAQSICHFVPFVPAADGARPQDNCATRGVRIIVSPPVTQDFLFKSVGELFKIT